MKEQAKEQAKEQIKILAIETSCDETSAAVVSNGRYILSNIVASQAELHVRYGGVVPEIASRKHVELFLPVIEKALDDAGQKPEDISAIGVAHGPGLAGALLVGLMAAKTIAYVLGKPLIGVHHIEGHIAANYLKFPDLEPPFVCLVASGGHSHIVHVRDFTEFQVIGRTRDDAAGEAFDKVARVLGLPYPGGPNLEKAAVSGNRAAFKLPVTYFNDGSFDFSFSGIKTSVVNLVNSIRQKGAEVPVSDIAASFQEAVTGMLATNAIKAANKSNCGKIVLAGGVAANKALREKITNMSKNEQLTPYFPDISLCTDNAAMIGSAAYFHLLKGDVSSLDLNAEPSLKLG
ncbi:MAG: tRNA (adenosine(37)-N6)-threonylcarbamoyltransferase complex transferase subunit TsaD [Clostridiales bacterium]|nr:tRNA (adenosine(37)-N6)-threonylcarbamoyltransferase complex transferase subunit TsaD [Clostridiales bacterium]